MQTADQTKVHKLGDQASLDAGLLHEDPKVRLQARSIANGWQGKLQAWINDELHRGAENTAAVPLVITSQAAQILASFIVQTIRESGQDDVVGWLADLFAQKLPEAVVKFRDADLKGGNA